ncbi:MAG: hypothetical protein ORN83_16335, partial [Chthoniobacteraceae bacterium]|nr:hypothetical protein [Chthoniobacteraceae bacterium]
MAETPPTSPTPIVPSPESIRITLPPKLKAPLPAPVVGASLPKPIAAPSPSAAPSAIRPPIAAPAPAVIKTVPVAPAGATGGVPSKVTVRLTSAQVVQAGSQSGVVSARKETVRLVASSGVPAPMAPPAPAVSA